MLFTAVHVKGYNMYFECSKFTYWRIPQQKLKKKL